MITRITKALTSIKTMFFKRPSKQKVENIEKPIILFQPNTLSIKNNKEAPLDMKTIGYPCKIVIECNKTTENLLQNLSQFFEISQSEALTRGLWLLAIARDVEIANKKIGIITIDNNNVVNDVVPIVIT
mgnify:CR=1 FL=1